MNETLRRATILPWFSRKAAQDFSIDGEDRGSDVFHHKPAYGNGLMTWNL